MDTPPEENTGARATDSASDFKPVFAQTSAVSDQSTSNDSLGFKLYVEALANFLLADATFAPFTISIEGAWGSGKSSFMLQLKERIKAQSAGAVTIDFNAWKYDKQEELWAAFALTVSRSLRRSTPLLHRIVDDIWLYFSRLKGLREGAKLMAKFIVCLALASAFTCGVVWSFRASNQERFAVVQKTVEEIFPPKAEATSSPIRGGPPDSGARATSSNAASPGSSNSSASESIAGARTSPTKNWFLLLMANSPLLTGLILVVWAIRKLPGVSEKTLFEIELEQYIDRPDYKGKAAFVDAFSEDFGKMVRAYAPKGGAKVFVFVDDLDRCEVPKAADLMQAINLMIGDSSPLFFIIGLDRGKVAASIAFKYSGIAPYLLSPAELAAGANTGNKPDCMKIRALGDEFLEKFIQISFPIPVSDNDEQAKEFINSLISSSVDPVSRPNWLLRFAPWLMKSGQSNVASVRPSVASESDRDPQRIERGPESERIRSVLLMVREILGHNPRRIKAFLNKFRLMLYIASSQGLLDKDRNTGIAEVTPEQLGKFIALTSVYPEMLAESLEHESFFHELEFYLTFGQTRNVDQLASEDYVEQWLRKPGVRTLFVPPRTLTTAWKNTYSLERFPVSKFVRVLPPVPVPQQRLSKIKIQFTSTENETARSVPISANNDPSAPSPQDPRFTRETSQPTLATGITFQQSEDTFPTSTSFQQVDTLPESHGAESERSDASVIRQAPDQESKDALPSARSVSAAVRFSDPVFPEEKQIDGKHQKGIEELDAPPSARTASVQNVFSEPVFPEEKQIDGKHQEGVEELAAPPDKDPSPETDGVGSDSPASKVTGGVIRQIL